MKVHFIISDPDPKKHSVKFAFKEMDNTGTVPVSGISLEAAEKALKAFAVYLPKPICTNSTQIRVTLEEIL